MFRRDGDIASEAASAIEILKRGGVGVMGTDTIYGVVCSSFSPEAVERVYEIKGRDTKKPCIVLIGSVGELARFRVSVSEKRKELFKKIWPGAVSVILACPDDEFEYLHRGTKSLAFRVPAPKEFREFISETGPLVAPSANPEGVPPAKTTREARAYFGDSVDFYLDAGRMAGDPSTLIKLEHGTMRVLREGEKKISEL